MLGRVTLGGEGRDGQTRTEKKYEEIVRIKIMLGLSASYIMKIVNLCQPSSVLTRQLTAMASHSRLASE